MNTLVKQHITLRDGVGYLADYPHLKAYLVATMHLAGNQPIETVAEHYQIDLADVYAAIAYYYDNQETIENAVAEKLKMAKQIGQANFREE